MTTTSTELTLYDLSNELAQLSSVRSEMVEAGEETTEIDTQIAVYMQALPTKVDGVAKFLLHLAGQEKFAEEEERRLKAAKFRFRAAREALTGFVMFVLQRLPLPKHGGPRKLEGHSATLSAVQNGGKQELIIDNDQLVPAEYRNYIVCFSHNEWLHALELLGSPAVKNADRPIDKALVRDTLLSPCLRCQNDPESREGCEKCGGSGYQTVAGAHLADRGYRLRIS